MAAFDRTRLTGSSRFPRRSRGVGFLSGRRGLRWFLIIATLLFCLGAAYSLWRGSTLFKGRVESYHETLSIEELWKEGRYAEIIRLAEERLSIAPMDPDALLYAGYAGFYLAISRNAAEHRISDLDACIAALRRFRARGDGLHSEQLDYVLGKAYFLKGPYWADLAVEYLESSMAEGYRAADIHEFIGRAYSSLGDLETALIWYTKAAENNPTDRLFLAIGEDAFRLGRYDTAAHHYRTVIEETKDENLRRKGLLQLGQLYYNVGNYEEAKRVLEQLVSLDPEDVHGYFLLGETYQALGDEEAARLSWFQVTKRDPKHVGALRRLYN